MIIIVVALLANQTASLHAKLAANGWSGIPCYTHYINLPQISLLFILSPLLHFPSLTFSTSRPCPLEDI